MTIHKTIALNLLRLRREKALTQEELSHRIGKSQNWVKEVETGHKKISLDYLVLCSNALGCSLHELIPERISCDE